MFARSKSLEEGDVWKPQFGARFIFWLRTVAPPTEVVVVCLWRLTFSRQIGVPAIEPLFASSSSARSMTFRRPDLSRNSTSHEIPCDNIWWEIEVCSWRKLERRWEFDEVHIFVETSLFLAHQLSILFTFEKPLNRTSYTVERKHHGCHSNTTVYYYIILGVLDIKVTC